MAIAKKKQAPEAFITECKVTRAKEWSEGNISFDMELFSGGMTIYNCTYRSGKKGDKEYAFVSFPQRKGSDGNYYNHVYFKIGDELLKNIEDQLGQML